MPLSFDSAPANASVSAALTFTSESRPPSARTVTLLPGVTAAPSAVGAMTIFTGSAFASAAFFASPTAAVPDVEPPEPEHAARAMAAAATSAAARTSLR
ncbi:hypothetical protein GCM10018771_18910 [Streptomyces cellulosae]|nr:hypothetical protein GCM10018771_18910 [Streptomyces cellulosae]